MKKKKRKLLPRPLKIPRKNIQNTRNTTHTHRENLVYRIHKDTMEYGCDHY